MSVKSKSVGTLKRMPSGVVKGTAESPVGKLTLVGSDKGLHALLWPSDLEVEECLVLLEAIETKEELEIFNTTRIQLAEYFAGERREFSLNTLAFGTDFQKEAWKSLCEIPYGEVITYKEQAIRLGDQKKVRAVGGANGRNPLSIIVPCHRVIAQGGDLRGFGGGLETKSFLLKLEKSIL